MGNENAAQPDWSTVNQVILVTNLVILLDEIGAIRYNTHNDVRRYRAWTFGKVKRLN